MPLFADDNERKQALLTGSAAALHALISAGHPIATPEERTDAIAQAHETALEFIRLMERIAK